MTDIDTSKMRAALAELPEGSSYGETPSLANVYLPQSHLKALHPDVAIVTGMRGAGKTFWWSALQDESVRKMIGERHARTGLSEHTVLRTGFGVRPAMEEYPSKDVLRQLLEQNNDARLVWRTVQAWQLAPEADELRHQPNWSSRAIHVRDNPERIDRLFAQQDAKLEDENVNLLVLYDALDRSADDWRTTYRLIRGLVQTALDMRFYRRIRVKVFLRTDQFDLTEIGDFPDASKLLSTAVELSWPRRELYGLLWHLLGNATSSAKDVRTMLHDGQTDLLTSGSCSAWQVPSDLVFDEALQRRTLHAIAGEWMGTDRRRGFPYTWIPNHLGDAAGKASPRSFIAALQAAAKDTRERHPNHEYALHYDSIKRGVQTASENRVKELSEDYPWVDGLLRDLQGMTVPCDFADIAMRWKNERSLTRLRENIEQKAVRLPPSRIEEGEHGVREDLQQLSVFQRMYDGRVNVPDVFRVGYGLGRRGGVRPVY